MSRLRVVHAAKFYPPSRGGMETVIADLCNGTSADWDVRVIAANENAKTLRERVGNVDVLRAAAFGSAASVPLCPSYPNHLWRQPADCVVLHEPNPVAGAALFVRNPARRLVVWHHSDLLRPWWAPHTYGHLQRALYRRAACVIVSSPNLARSSPLVQQARKVIVIPFGVQLERFRLLTPEQRELAEHLKQTVAGPRVLFVGRFVYYKGVDVLVDAMARCTGTLILVGDGPLEAALRARASALGIESRLMFAGRVSDEELPAYYHAADVFVLPSVAKTEAFGVVQVEAMAAGLPVVSTSLNTGVPWVNQHNVSGIVVEPGSAESLAKALNWLSTNPDLRSRLARGAAARAGELFSVERMVATFKTVVEQAIHAPGKLVDARAVGVGVS
jgi:glycosyltransferase involved in cell wall biosynthesis